MPSVAIRREGQVVLMDCGEGTQGSFVRYGLGLNREMVILITHLHGDHVNGLLGLLQTMAMSRRVRTLTIVGPQALFLWLKNTMEVLNIGLTFDLRFFPAKGGVVYRGSDFRIRASRAVHSVESWSYRFEEDSRPGVFDPEKAKALGIPEGKKWSTLQRGRSVIVKGKRFVPGQVLGPRRAGRSVGYSGDTRPSKSLVRFFAGVDLLVFESTFASKDADKAVLRKHSTAAEAAEVAREAGARGLVLTHFSARYTRTESLLREARRIFGNTIAAHDGLTVDVPAVSGR